MTREQFIFAKAVWQLFNHRDEILANPRMAYAPIDMHNVLAYADALEKVPLGVYLEWWMKCAGTLHTNERGQPSLMVRFAGSPLTGMNECTMVARPKSYPRTSQGVAKPKGAVWVWVELG